MSGLIFVWCFASIFLLRARILAVQPACWTRYARCSALLQELRGRGSAGDGIFVLGRNHRGRRR